MYNGIVDYLSQSLRQHHRVGIPVLPECLEQCRCKPEISLHKLLHILRSIHPSKVEHEVRLSAPSVEFRESGVEVVFKYPFDTPPVMPDLIGHLKSIVPRLPVPDIFRLSTKVFTYKSFGSCYKYVHFLYMSILLFLFSKPAINPFAFNSLQILMALRL